MELRLWDEEDFSQSLTGIRGRRPPSQLDQGRAHSPSHPGCTVMFPEFTRRSQIKRPGPLKAVPSLSLCLRKAVPRKPSDSQEGQEALGVSMKLGGQAVPEWTPLGLRLDLIYADVTVGQPPFSRYPIHEMKRLDKNDPLKHRSSPEMQWQAVCQGSQGCRQQPRDQGSEA